MSIIHCAVRSEGSPAEELSMVAVVTPAATAGRCGSSTGDCAFGDRRSVTGGTRGLSTTLGAAERAAGVFEIASATPEGFCSGRGLSATEAEAPERFSPVVTPETRSSANATRGDDSRLSAAWGALMNATRIRLLAASARHAKLKQS